LISLVVIEWTYTSSWTLFSLLALFHFIIVGMEFTFFPAMTILTQIALRTALFIIGQKVLIIPFRTVYVRIVVFERRTSEVLPIVSIYAFRLIMFSVIERTPLSLIVEDIKVIIHLIVMDQLSLHFFFRVSK